MGRRWFSTSCCWCGPDTAAYYVGRAWGRRKLAPRISPNKTWEGAIASLAATVLIAAGLVGLADLLTRWNIAIFFYADEPIWYWLALAVLVNAAARWASASGRSNARPHQDSGSLLPGHGGVLDRIDAFPWPPRYSGYAQVIHHSF